jgi:hypothetical protein
MKAAALNASSQGGKYPPDIDQQPNYFAITMRPYSLGIATGVDAGGVAGPGGKSFFLPMPRSGLKDEFIIDYARPTMGAVGGVGSSISDFVSGRGSLAGNVLSALGSFGRTLGEETMGAALGDAGVAGTQLLTGAINNPNLAAVFKGVDLRKHSFTWEMIAYSYKESKMIDDMVFKLKQCALPKRTSGGNFGLEFPDVAYLQVVGPQENGMITFSEKGAFVTNINVDYMGKSHPSFFTDSKSPVEVTLSMSFLERSIITRTVGE